MRAEGVGDGERRSAGGRRGAQLWRPRAAADAVTAFLQRARDERTPAAPGARHGVRRRRIQPAEGERILAGPQRWNPAARVVATGWPDARVAGRTRPLETRSIGADGRGRSDRDGESRGAEAGLGAGSPSPGSRIGRELRARSPACPARGLAGEALLGLCLDAIYRPPRPRGAPEGVRGAWGDTRTGARGRRDGRRGLRAPALGVTDGAPGWSRALEELGPDAARQGGAVHRLSHLLATLPNDAARHERVRTADGAALDEAVAGSDAAQRLRGLVAERERPAPSAAAGLADDLPALPLHLRDPGRWRRRRRSTTLLERSREAVRRRTTGIGRSPGEPRCRSLCWAVRDVIRTGANGLGLTDLDRRALPRLPPPRTRLRSSPHLRRPPSLAAGSYSRAETPPSAPSGAPTPGWVSIRSTS